jgi:quinol monooxygenase YgiN
MDKEVTFFTQIEEQGGPIILINKFNVKPEEVEQFLRVWAADAQVMKQRPGFISAQLHRGIAGSCVFVNYAMWESPEHLKEAYNHPEFQSLMGHYPESVTASPHLFRKVAVPGICVAG